MMRDGYNIFGKRIPCRNAYCANNPRSRSHMGEVCDDCEARERREDEESPRCPVCEVRRDDHGDVLPCPLDVEQD